MGGIIQKVYIMDKDGLKKLAQIIDLISELGDSVENRATAGKMWAMREAARELYAAQPAPPSLTPEHRAKLLEAANLLCEVQDNATDERVRNMVRVRLVGLKTTIAAFDVLL